MIVSIKVISATYDRECLMGNRGGVKPSPGNQHLTSKRLTNNKCETERSTFCIEYNIEANVQWPIHSSIRESISPFAFSLINSIFYLVPLFQNSSRPSIAFIRPWNNIFLLSIHLSRKSILSIFRINGLSLHFPATSQFICVLLIDALKVNL